MNGNTGKHDRTKNTIYMLQQSLLNHPLSFGDGDEFSPNYFSEIIYSILSVKLNHKITKVNLSFKTKTGKICKTPANQSTECARKHTVIQSWPTPPCCSSSFQILPLIALLLCITTSDYNGDAPSQNAGPYGQPALNVH